MSLHKKINNLKDLDFYGHMGVVADLLKKNPEEFTEDQYQLLRNSFYKLFHWCHNKQEEVKHLTDIAEEYREEIIKLTKETKKLKKLFKI